MFECLCGVSVSGGGLSEETNKRHGGEWVECYIGNLDIDGAGLLT